MALLRTEAEKLSNNDLISGVIEEIIDREETFALLPFVGVNGKAYVYNRENVLATASWLDPNTNVPEDASTFTTVTALVKILIGDVDVDKFLQTMDDTNDQKATQIALKAKALAREFHRTFAEGDEGTTPQEFDGLPNQVTVGQTMQAGTNGAALALTMLDELADMVPNGADAYVMRSGTIRAYYALLRAAGGTTPVMIELENFGKPVLSHNGIPILRNDYLAINETLGSGTDLTSVYAVRMNEADGLHGIYAGPNAGIVVEDIGTVQNRDATRTRLKWYTGLALKSTRSLARLEGITNI